ncbi:hypothetical protein LCGC14_1590040, partial [marine sediment metagenome]
GAVVAIGEWLATAFWPLGERTRLLAPKEVLGFFEDAKEVLAGNSEATLSDGSGSE